MTQTRTRAVRWGALIAACWLGGCLGGQTGDADGSGEGIDGEIEPGRCEPIKATLGLDDPLPSGETARELLERVADKTVPAFAWQSEEALHELFTIEAIDVVTPELAEAELELRVRVRYDGGSEIALYRDDCHWSDAIALPVTVSVEASDGSVERAVRGILYSTPAGAYSFRDARAFFYADEDQIPPQNAYVDRSYDCSEGPSELSFASDGTPQGTLCDDRGRALLFPTACGGIAQTPLDEQATAELPAPSEILSELGERTRYRATWPDGTTSTLELTLTPESELACHFEDEYGVAWYAALELRVEWVEEGIAYTQRATLSMHEGPLVDLDNPPMELASQALLSDEMIALFADRLDEPALFFADSTVMIRQTPEGELERYFKFFGSRDVDEGDNEIDVRLPLDPVTN